ncbi:MAG: ATP-binding protein, partial [Actinomycetota bacterium]|nr:ATP-binding protein [Actinomycetota bacterium]
RPVGTGLGLSIAARLVERLGGTISAHSADGGGAMFRIVIPG